MTMPDWLARLLPSATASTWPVIASLLTEDAALYGGTSLAVHLRHRLSRDLDVFCTKPFDPDRLEAELHARGAFAVTVKTEGKLNGIFEDTEVQFLHADRQRVLETPAEIAGMRIAGMSDLIATKLNAVVSRGELRDYYDLKAIEQQTGRTMEEGIGLYNARYEIADPGQQAMIITRALGAFDDVGDDPTLPETRAEITDYWNRRQPEISTHLDQYGMARLPDDQPR
jgi:hypothetical protein